MPFGVLKQHNTTVPNRKMTLVYSPIDYRYRIESAGWEVMRAHSKVRTVELDKHNNLSYFLCRKYTGYWSDSPLPPPLPHIASIKTRMSQAQVLERLQATSETCAKAQVTGIYCAFTEQLMESKSRKRTFDAYLDDIILHCSHNCSNIAVATLRTDIIKINVGGRIFMIKREALISNQSDQKFLFVLLSGRWNFIIPKDRNGIIFLDLDPSWIEPSFDVLRRQLIWGSQSI